MSQWGLFGLGYGDVFTRHVVKDVRAPVSPNDGHEDVVEVVEVFGADDSVPEEPSGLVRHDLQHCVCGGGGFTFRQQNTEVTSWYILIAAGVDKGVYK